MTWTIGVDVGGTFTDFFAANERERRIVSHKTPSTPDDPARAILDGLAVLIARERIAAADVRLFAHGTTIGTNALIERRGGRVAVVTTAGFRDLLEIGRQTRPRLYDFQTDNPAPLASRDLRFEIPERMDAAGHVVHALTDDAVAAAVAAVRASGADACAVCFLFSYVNPAHEARVGAALGDAVPALPVSLSSSVHPEFREFERFSTAVLNAYLQPTVSSYLRTLTVGLESVVGAASVGINQSNGGLMSVETAERFPVRTVLSGPAAGVVGAIHVGRTAGRSNVITLDMGGTSADVCLIRDGAASLSFTRDVAGFPVRLPMLDVNTVGAGGGSIAWFDKDGLIKVGPRSAGAVPGPACYGRGGTQPTVSDANLLLGRLDPSGLLGGAMPLDRAAARRAITPVAERLGMTAERAAHGILAIVVANMVRAIRTVSVERGFDPRDFALMPFGGAGALHATDVARSLGMTEIVVPPHPGLLCAEGLIVAERREDHVASTRIVVSDANLPRLQAAVDRLHGEARAWFEREAIAPAARRCWLALDMRHVGQNHEIRVAIAPDAPGEPSPRLPAADRLCRMFATDHERSYGYANQGDAVEVVNVRLTARAAARTGDTTAAGAGAAPAAAPAAVDVRPVYFTPDLPVATHVYRRDSLAPGAVLVGPAVIDQLDATTLVHPDDRVHVDRAGNLVITLA
ncbi:MAG: hydantoinase/oxoprolinase family protein [Alphaproteobacteria bacterium]|nr:hydantoinase/oxoprolinase family protein [Alphaproteobacteria bacterium]